MKHVHNLLETCKNKLHNSSKDSSKLYTLNFFIQSLYTKTQMQSIHKMYIKLSFNTFNNLPKPTIDVQAFVFTILQL
jgi:SET domain-containing protein